MEAKTSKNERAEQLLGRRLTPEHEADGGIMPIDCPCELGYWCPVCRRGWDEELAWSEYAAMLWCPRCDFDWPSALCVRLDAAPDPKRPWVNAGRDAAVGVFLAIVESAIARAALSKAVPHD